MDFTLYGVSATLVILGCVEAAKQAGMASRFAPLAAWAIGLALGLLSQVPVAHPDYVQGAVLGIAAALSASGLYSGVAKLSSTPRSESVPAAATEPTPPPA